MKTMLILTVLFICLQTSAANIKPTDPKATPETVKLYQNLLELGISFHIAEAHSEVRDTLRLEGLEDLFGHISRRDSLHDIVITCIAEHIENERKIYDRN